MRRMASSSNSLEKPTARQRLTYEVDIPALRTPIGLVTELNGHLLPSRVRSKSIKEGRWRAPRRYGKQ